MTYDYSLAALAVAMQTTPEEITALLHTRWDQCGGFFPEGVPAAPTLSQWYLILGLLVSLDTDRFMDPAVALLDARALQMDREWIESQADARARWSAAGEGGGT